MPMADKNKSFKYHKIKIQLVSNYFNLNITEFK